MVYCTKPFVPNFTKTAIIPHKIDYFSIDGYDLEMAQKVPRLFSSENSLFRNNQ